VKTTSLVVSQHLNPKASAQQDGAGSGVLSAIPHQSFL